MSAPENETGFAAPTAKPAKQYIANSVLFNTKTAPGTQAQNNAKSRLSDARLAAKLDDIIARAEQQTKYALADHRLMLGLGHHDPAPRPRRVSINVRGGTLVARVLSPEAEVKLVAYARRLSREVSDIPLAGQDWDEGDAE